MDGQNSVFIIVGLGNPGPEYQETRHNVGFMVLDTLSQRKQLQFSRGRGRFLQTSYRQGREKVLLIKPLTFMNLSGQAVQEAVRYYKLTDLSKLLVVCDDLNLPFGTIRLRRSGSDGGQKGLRSVIESLGTREFPRLRVGIGNHFSDAVQFVLSPFTRQEKEDLPVILEWATDAVEAFVSEGIDRAMSKFNRHILEK